MRVRWVDYAKGFGIILVVLGHVLRGLIDADFEVPLFSYIDEIIYGFHMPLFFLLSGLFVGRWIERSFKLAISQKAAQLLRPYLIWSLVQGAIMIALNSVTNGNTLTWSNLLYKIVINPFGQFWFMYTLFFVFILYYGLRIRFNIKMIVLIAFIYYLVAPYFRGLGELEALGVNFLYFVMGAGLYNNIHRITCLIKGKNALFVTTLFVVLNCTYIMMIESAFNENIIHLYQIVVAVSGILFIIACSEWLVKQDRLSVVELLGRSSMTIYLLHILAASGSRIILSNILHVDNIWVHIIVGLLAGITLPLFGHYIAAKIRIEQMLFSYQLRQHKRTTT